MGKNASISMVSNPDGYSGDCFAATLFYRDQERTDIYEDAKKIADKYRLSIHEVKSLGNSKPYGVRVVFPEGEPNAKESLNECLIKLGYNINS